jgi:hypothetical protein
VDVGQALVSQGGALRKVYFFVMVLPYSDAIYVQAFGHARTEMFWEFHRRAFAYLGGVPRRISYDSDKVLVSAITGARSRRLTCGFPEPARSSCSCKVATGSRRTSGGLTGPMRRAWWWRQQSSSRGSSSSCRCRRWKTWMS